MQPIISQNRCFFTPMSFKFKLMGTLWWWWSSSECGGCKEKRVGQSSWRKELGLGLFVGEEGGWQWKLGFGEEYWTIVFECSWNGLMISLEVLIGSLPTTFQVLIYYYIEIWISSGKSLIQFDNLVISFEIIDPIWQSSNLFWMGLAMEDERQRGHEQLGMKPWQRHWELRWLGKASMKKGISTPKNTYWK